MGLVINASDMGAMAQAVRAGWSFTVRAVASDKVSVTGRNDRADAEVAFFGAPQETEDVLEWAVKSALTISESEGV